MSSVSPDNLSRFVTRPMLATILQTQSSRYWLIASWALALGFACGPWIALAWWAATFGWAGWLRSQFENWAARRGGTSFSMFPLVGMTSAVFWAAAPFLAWRSGGLVGIPTAMLMLAVGYQLTFTQVGAEPRKAIIITLPYTVMSLIIAATMWGDPSRFAAYLVALPVVYGGLAFSVHFTRGAQKLIAAQRVEQQRLIHELERSRDAAEAASRAKSAFLAMISHELRTPMNGVLGCMQLLERTTLNTEQRELVRVGRSSGGTLMKLLNDVLDLSKAEADRIEIDCVDQATSEIIDDVANIWRSTAVAKGLDFNVRLVGEIPAVIFVDGARIEQVLHNLLSNAAKFTSEGGISLEVESHAVSDTRAALQFRVTDTGPGVSDSEAESLFQPFVQADATVTRKFGGTGLGLTISRRLARLMGGDLTLESDVGRGSTFLLRLEVDVVQWEAQAQSMTAERAQSLYEGRSLQILVVEDHPVNRMVLGRFLEAFHHEVTSAENGLIATQLAEATAYDLILMDLNMPIMHGLTAISVIRASTGPNRDTPMVVLSAAAADADRQAGYAAGSDGYLAKPLDFTELARLLDCVQADDFDRHSMSLDGRFILSDNAQDTSPRRGAAFTSS